MSTKNIIKNISTDKFSVLTAKHVYQLSKRTLQLEKRNARAAFLNIYILL